MDYIYGTSQRFGTPCENLKTVGDKHSDLNGYIQTVNNLSDGTKITDHCRVIRKYASKESSGTCYDWYLIDNHYRETDTSAKEKAMVDKVNANLDYISMMSGINIPTEEGANKGGT